MFSKKVFSRPSLTPVNEMHVSILDLLCQFHQGSVFPWHNLNMDQMNTKTLLIFFFFFFNWLQNNLLWQLIKYARKNQNSIFLHTIHMAYMQTVADPLYLDILWMGCCFLRVIFFQTFSDWIEYKGPRHSNYPSSSCPWNKHSMELRYSLLRKRILAVFHRKVCFSKFYFRCQGSFCVQYGSGSAGRDGK